MTPKEGTFYKLLGLWSFCLPITDLRVHNHYLIILGRYVSISYLTLLMQGPTSKRSVPRLHRCRQLENIRSGVNIKTCGLNMNPGEPCFIQYVRILLYFLVHLTPSAVSMWTFPICTSRFMFVWGELNSHQSLGQYFNTCIVLLVQGIYPTNICCTILLTIFVLGLQLSVWIWFLITLHRKVGHLPAQLWEKPTNIYNHIKWRPP